MPCVARALQALDGSSDVSGPVALLYRALSTKEFVYR